MMTRRRARRERIAYNLHRRAHRLDPDVDPLPPWAAGTRCRVVRIGGRSIPCIVLPPRLTVATLEIRFTLGADPLVRVTHKPPPHEVQHVITDKCLADPDSDWSGV